MKVFIIEDDIVWRTKVQIVIDELGFETIGYGEDVLSCQEKLGVLSPDLIISDIVLGEKLVFEVFEGNEKLCKIPVVFVTNSVEENVYEAARVVEKHIYLVKPLHYLTLKSAIDFLISEPADYEEREDYTIAVKGRYNEKITLQSHQILWVEQKRNYCFIKTELHQYSLKASLVNISKNLDSNFMQTHRGFYVNKNFIDRITTNIKNIIIKNHTLPVGKTYRDNLKRFWAHRVEADMSKVELRSLDDIHLTTYN